MPTRISAATALVALALSAGPAHAHAVHVDWKVAGTELVVVAYFNDEIPADDAEVTLRGADGTVIATGRTDDTGTWKHPTPPPGSYQLHIKALAGHEKTVTVVLAPAATEADEPPPDNTLAWLIAGVVVGVAAVSLVLWLWLK